MTWKYKRLRILFVKYVIVLDMVGMLHPANPIFQPLADIIAPFFRF